MPHVKLTARQEAFCQGIADGMGQADAYRAAYNCAKWKDAVIYSKASVLMKHGKVVERVRELRSAIEEKQLWSREMSVKALVEAYKEGSGSVKVAAVRELNAMHGYNEPARVTVTTKQLPASVDDFC